MIALLGDALRGAESGIAVARATMRPARPDILLRGAVATVACGPTLAGGVAGSTARDPGASAVIDDRGALSYWELWRQSDAIACELRRLGVDVNTTIGILARDHRGFVRALVAAAKTGADVVLLNTGFAAPALSDVIAREGVEILIHDDEFADVVAHTGVGAALAEHELEGIAQDGPAWLQRPARHQGRLIVLTSGTTGAPKGALRQSKAGVILQVLATLPVRSRDTVVVSAPLFHSWGLGHLSIGLGFSSTAVLHRSFDPEAVLHAVDRHRPDGLVLVPVMLQRILDLGGEAIARYDTSSLRYVACSGSAIGATLSSEAIGRFGPILYNAYGSTEVSLATVASPRDLLSEPATAGRVVPGSVVRILSPDDAELEPGEVGRIFVGSWGQFDGYTDGTGKAMVDGLVASGDLGHFDDAGRLFIDGREDDMIVSGGENVFPAEVEDVLMQHAGIADVAVIGETDAGFGQRLKAFVVRRRGVELSADDVRAHVRSQLARYKVPATVEFCSELPRTATGKLRRIDLSAG